MLNKTSSTIDQELWTELLAGKPQMLLQMLHVHTPEGWTFLGEMTSWPPSWKYDLTSKCESVNRWVYKWRTILRNFIPVWFEMKQPWAFFEEVTPNNNKKNKMSSDVGSVPDPQLSFWSSVEKNKVHSTAKTIAITKNMQNIKRGNARNKSKMHKYFVYIRTKCLCWTSGLQKQRNQWILNNKQLVQGPQKVKR